MSTTIDQSEIIPEQEPLEASDPCVELEHKYKLALADYQNLLKQTAKERKDTILYANEALVLELLPIYDNLKLSVRHLDEKAASDSWVTGIQHIISQFKKVLAGSGVIEIETEGQRFDPVSMEAVENRETVNEAQKDMVAEELKGGYRLHEKVIIPARVAVFKNNKTDN